jgi:uncharacterized protein YkwD
MSTIYLPFITNNHSTNLLHLINNKRIELNLNTLINDELLSNVAVLHSKSMYDNDYIQHNSYERIDNVLIFKQLWNERICEHTGYCNVCLGEVIAVGAFNSNEEILNAFLNSSKHAEILLSAIYTNIGIGIYEHYITIDLKG